MSAWFMGEVIDQREECRQTPNKEATRVDLAHINVEQITLDMNSDWETELDRLKLVYEMKFKDEIHISRETLPDYDNKIKMFFEEHLHKDAELRFIKEGSGYFDVRSIKNDWIRIPVVPGDFIFLPAGIFHRFTPDMNENIRAIRLFATNPQWTAYNVEDGKKEPERMEYLRTIGKYNR